MKSLFCGIDFHKRTSTICTVDRNGKQLEMATITSTSVVKFFSNKKDDYLIGIEASGGTNHVVEKLKELGHDVRIINPNKFKAIGIGGKKTDEKDAQHLAEALRLNYIPEVHHKSIYARQIKSLIVGREMIVRTRVNMMNHTRGILREYGLTMPQGVENFLKNIATEIDKIECQFIKDHLIYLHDKIKDFLTQEARLQKQLEEYLVNDEKSEKLRSVPGIGPMTTATLIAVIDDSKRFKNSKQFASYLGLVPSERSSGDKKRMGSITRSGSEILRRYLIHGARTNIMNACRNNNLKDPNLRWAKKLKEKIGMNKATVALAHRMARIAFAIIRDDGEYNKNYSQRLAVIDLAS